MGKNTHFSGQPLYTQLFKLTDRKEIARTSLKCNHERYVKKLDSYSHFVIMLYAVPIRHESLREIVVGMLYEANKINHLGIGYMVKRSTLAEANNRCGNEFFERIYFSLHRNIKIIWRIAERTRLGNTYCIS